MNKKIFLTSMVALMIACPAFGTACLDGQGNCGEIPGTTADCNNPPLEYHSQGYSTGTYTLTAQWQPDTFDVTYVAGQNCSGSDSDTATYAASYTVLSYSGAGMTANTGYHLPTGSTWSSDWTNGDSTTPGTHTGGNISAGSMTYYIPDDLTLTMPDCVPDDYTVTYDCNGGTMKTVSPVWSSSTGVDSVTYATTDYTFRDIDDVCEKTDAVPTNWTCTVDGSSPLQSFSPSNGVWYYAFSVTCVAGWNDVLTLIWNPDNGQNSDTNTCTWGASASDANGAKVPTSLLNPTKPGYTFTGWLVTDHQ